MKSRFLLSAMFLLLIVGLYVPASYSQLTYQVTLKNEVFSGPGTANDTTYQFDVFIKNTSTDGESILEIGGLQLSFSYNVAALDGGTLKPWIQGLPAKQSGCRLVPASSGLTVMGPNGTGLAVAGAMAPTVINFTDHVGILEFPSPAPPGAGKSEGIYPGDEYRVGTYRLINSKPFAFKVNLAYDFSVYKCIIAGYMPGGQLDNQETNTDITSSGTFVNLLTNAALPVELSAFTSTAQGRTVVLNWSTKTEKNSNRFDVERSLVSNSAWSTVASVKAAVLSNSTKSYTYTDNKLQSGKYQYRLKMVDNDGSFSYSTVQTAEVSMPKDFAVSQNYPNPFNPTTKIDYQVPVDAKVIMEIYNIAGQKVMEVVNQEQSAGYYTVNFGSSKLASGVYIYRLVASDKVTGNNFSSIKKMMLLK